MKKPPDYKYIFEDIIIAILIFGIFSLGTWILLWYLSLGTEPPEVRSGETYLSTYSPTQDFSITQGTAFMSISPMPFEKPIVLSSLMKCLIREESGGNPNAWNKADPNGGSFGILQYQIKTFQDYCVERYGLKDDIWDKDTQLRCCQMMLEEDKDNVFHWSTAYLCL